MACPDRHNSQTFHDRRAFTDPQVAGTRRHVDVDRTAARDPDQAKIGHLVEHVGRDRRQMRDEDVGVAARIDADQDVWRNGCPRVWREDEGSEAPGNAGASARRRAQKPALSTVSLVKIIGLP